MIGLDTNVVIRLLTGDDPHQQEIAKLFIAKHCSSDAPAFINRVVLIETVWVLESAYAYPPKAIAAALEGLLHAERILAEDADAVRVVLQAYREGCDFADAMIAATNVRRGCLRTATFDRKAAKRNMHFEVL